MSQEHAAGGKSDAPAGPVEETRTLGADDLTYINRMTTVGHVLPSVAHELNNSLQVIGGLVEILSMRAEVPRDVLDKIQKIGAQAARSAGLIREFVAFARRDDTMARVDLRRALDQALAFRRYHLARARINLTVDPVEPGPLLIAADSQHVTQVLLNLIINAEEALGGRDVRELTIRVSDLVTRVRCEVHDSGPGLSVAARAHLREPFRTTKGRGCAGLGLSVVGTLVERTGGQLSVTDASGCLVVVEWPKA